MASKTRMPVLDTRDYLLIGIRTKEGHHPAEALERHASETNWSPMSRWLFWSNYVGKGAGEHSVQVDALANDQSPCQRTTYMGNIGKIHAGVMLWIVSRVAGAVNKCK